MNDINRSESEILVTGGAGFIGTHLCRKLVRAKHAVTVLDIRTPQSPVSGVKYVRGDVRDPLIVRELVGAASTVYHLAAIVSVPLCQKDPFDSYSTNFTGTLVLLNAIREQAQDSGRRPARVVFASSAALYGNKGTEGRALREEDRALRFSSFYAAQKGASEQALDQYRQAFGVPSIAFRFFNVYGQGQDPSSPYSGVITVFSRLAREGRPLPLNGGGRQTRDFISVEDVVDGLARALELPDDSWNAQPVNLGTGTSVDIRSLAEMIRDATGKISALVEAAPREGDVLHSLADISIARELLRFQPKHALKERITALLKII